MMASKLPRVVPTCHKGGFGPWFELDWTGRPNHAIAARHVVLAEGKLTTYVYSVGTNGNRIGYWFTMIGFVSMITKGNRIGYRSCMLWFVESNLPALLDARLWRDGPADYEIWVGHRHGF
ncbi:hypothetical protein TIFTF001_040760 [Ficus carica]|uniref:Uncharacterized protein n=1 Tax=Ficus carica TaxID=3494 RepID=A0AA87ZG31_FICCA|nr:hypothetical protein TIFTF001_040756 [Ficus carica]GMN25690.1 hypothetical protein TIFTF001_040760 [Ficus carica]